jgi:NADPH:quinone reductase-like Zn-dependent oxidoreductase
MRSSCLQHDTQRPVCVRCGESNSSFSQRCARRTPNRRSKPLLDDIPGGRGVLVCVLRVGLDGTDKEMLSGEHGAGPPCDAYLITGHENFSVVEDVGANATGLRRCDFVVATVRRPDRALTTRSRRTSRSRERGRRDHALACLPLGRRRDGVISDYDQRLCSALAVCNRNGQAAAAMCGITAGAALRMEPSVTAAG